ncbi:MAG: ribonucrease [Pseudonocardiales bacterium]|nr:ribonucrease [Pseudonocardiales bacterium]
MSLTEFVAIAAVFVLILILGLRFLSLYAGRSSAREASVQRSAHGHDRVAEAETEADAVRQRAIKEADATRRAAEAEIESLRRAAQTEVAAARASADAARSRAETVAEDLIADARRAAERESQARLAALATRDEELTARAEALDRRESELEAQLRDVQARGVEVDAEGVALAELRSELTAATLRQELEHTAALERVAALTSEEAKLELLNTVEATARRDAAALVRTIETEARAEATDRARAIVVDAVQRVASEQTTETVVSVLHLPSDEMKGRIIGREGRNIRAFESVTGVNVIIDDTPEAVLLSCFDPVRREIARITLEKLVLDGRIHPHRIEEIYESAKVEVDELCLRAARDSLAEIGITDLDERLIPTLGRLKYRTSYGQNVLGHLTETAHIAGIMASELGLETSLIKRAAFLHDIGKALTHEVEGSHAIIGADLLRRYGESEAVAHAVEAHHNEVQPRTVEAVLTQAADACSAARPGARRESLEAYVKRLERIEQIATARPGVERVFAMQSGREVRVMVLPEQVDDLAAGVIAREVAKQIEDELTYPGQIRVTVVRESRATEVAH